MGKKVLTAADILAGCKVETAEFPLGGGVIKVKGLTKDRQLEARKSATENGELSSEALEVAIFKAGVIEPVLTEEELTQIRQTMPSGTFDAIVMEIAKLSGIQPEDLKRQAKKSLP